MLPSLQRLAICFILITHPLISPQENPCQHPVFLLRDVSFSDLWSVIEFVYKGEVNVRQADLASFLKTAEMLQLRGLTEGDAKVCAEWRYGWYRVTPRLVQRLVQRDAKVRADYRVHSRTGTRY